MILVTIARKKAEFEAKSASPPRYLMVGPKEHQLLAAEIQQLKLVVVGCEHTPDQVMGLTIIQTRRPGLSVSNRPLEGRIQ